MNFKYILHSILLLSVQMGFSQSTITGKILDKTRLFPGAPRNFMFVTAYRF